MTDKTPKPEMPAPTFVDDPKAPELFATEISGFFLHFGNVHLTLASARVDHSTSPGPINRVVNARLVMPVPAAIALVTGLKDFLQSRGIDVNTAQSSPDISKMN